MFPYTESKSLGFKQEFYVDIGLPNYGEPYELSQPCNLFDLNIDNGLFIAAKSSYIKVGRISDLHETVSGRSEDEESEIAVFKKGAMANIGRDIHYVKLLTDKLVLVSGGILLVKEFGKTDSLEKIVEIKPGSDGVKGTAFGEAEMIVDLKYNVPNNHLMALGDDYNFYIVDLGIEDLEADELQFKKKREVISFELVRNYKDHVYLGLKDSGKNHITKYDYVNKKSVYASEISIDINSEFNAISMKEVDDNKVLVVYDVDGKYNSSFDFDSLDEPRYLFYMLTLLPKDDPTLEKLDEDFCLNSSFAERDFYSYSTLLRDWEISGRKSDLFIVTTSLASFISFVTKNEALNPEDDAEKGSIPSDPVEFDELAVCGMSIDVTQNNFIADLPHFDEPVTGKCPVIWVFATTGLLSGFFFYDVSAIKEEKPFAALDYQISKLAKNPIKSAESSKSPFENLATKPSSSPFEGLASKPSSSLFGGLGSKPSSSPFGGLGSTPSSSPFGTDSKTSSVFGNTASKSSSSPFGTGSKPTSSLFGNVESKSSSSFFGNLTSKPSVSPFGSDSKSSASPFGNISSKPSTSPFGSLATKPLENDSKSSTSPFGSIPSQPTKSVFVDSNPKSIGTAQKAKPIFQQETPVFGKHGFGSSGTKISGFGNASGGMSSAFSGKHAPLGKEASFDDSKEASPFGGSTKTAFGDSRKPAFGDASKSAFGPSGSVVSHFNAPSKTEASKSTSSFGGNILSSKWSATENTVSKDNKNDSDQESSDEPEHSDDILSDDDGSIKPVNANSVMSLSSGLSTGQLGQTIESVGDGLSKVVLERPGERTIGRKGSFESKKENKKFEGKANIEETEEEQKNKGYGTESDAESPVVMVDTGVDPIKPEYKEIAVDFTRATRMKEKREKMPKSEFLRMFEKHLENYDKIAETVSGGPEVYELGKVNLPKNNSQNAVDACLSQIYYRTEAEYEILRKNGDSINEFIIDHSQMKKQLDDEDLSVKNIYSWRISEAGVLTKLIDRHRPEIEKLSKEIKEASDKIDKFKTKNLVEYFKSFDEFVENYTVLEENHKLIKGKGKKDFNKLDIIQRAALSVEFETIQKKVRAKLQKCVALSKEAETSLAALKGQYELNLEQSESDKLENLQNFMIKVENAVKVKMQDIQKILRDLEDIEIYKIGQNEESSQGSVRNSLVKSSDYGGVGEVVEDDMEEEMKLGNFWNSFKKKSEVYKESTKINDITVTVSI